MAKTTGKKTASTSSASAKGKSLVIVESPAKAKTINKYLGDDFIVRSSIGHVRDLPTSSGIKKKATSADEGLSKEEKALSQILDVWIEKENELTIYILLDNERFLHIKSHGKVDTVS